MSSENPAVHISDGEIFVSLEYFEPDTDDSFVLIVPVFSHKFKRTYEIADDTQITVIRAILPSLDRYGVYEMTETEDDEGRVLAHQIIRIF